ncbi:MAG TPA: isochorismate synthase [Roseiflexaceae bacterium]|nr:isochorismate synthase [Roseiflexaceae bacterium]
MTTNSQPAARVVSLRQQIQARLEEGVRRVGRPRRPTLLSVTLALGAHDPLALFARGATLSPHRFFWAHPQSRVAFAGLGVAWTAVSAGAKRFADAAESWRALCADALVDGPADSFGAGPLAVGGFRFDPERSRDPLWEGFPDGLLTLPRVLLARDGDECWLTVNSVLRPGEQTPDDLATLLPRIAPLLAGARQTLAPTLATDALRVQGGMAPDAWSTMVRGAVERLGQGGMDKVVLARSSTVTGPHPFDPASALARLRAAYPNCFTFALERGPRCFLGASPERLVGLRNGMIAATCLAGSIARGASQEEDARLGQALLDSHKDRVEHAIVLRELLADLADTTDGLSAPEAPVLMRLPNVQHLFTPVTGRAAPGVGVLDLVARLHPTPAVGGSPRGDALGLIRTSEPAERGWYAAPLGWIDARGEGEFAVALRSGLLHGATATLYAGCGIVAASDPEREYAESQLKLRPMLSALGK